jgi:hypothetical protein
MLTATSNSAVNQFHPEAIREVNCDDSLVEHLFDKIDLVRDLISLSQWLQHEIEPEWQDVVETSKRVIIETRSSVSNYEISGTIEQLKLSNDDNYRHQLIRKLGFIADGDRSAVQALIELIQTTQNDETLWIAVDSLREAAPSHPSAGISRFKSIDLCQPSNFKFIVNIVPKRDDRVAILLQVYPDSAKLYLPNNLKLILQDEGGNTLREVVSVDTDYCIQLKLSGTYREIFSVCLELDGIISIVDFVV